MDLYFERGERDNPVGHALVYFKVDTEPDKVYASYVVTLPIKSDLTKFLPPFLASHLGALPLNDLSSFAMPPVPEPVDGFDELERLSRQRGDDLVYAGSMFSYDLPRMMESVTEAVSGYGELYAAAGKSATVVGGEATTGEPEVLPSAEEPAEELDSSFNVNDVLFSFMSESDKLSELSRLLGRLRFAVEGADQSAATEVGEEIAALARHLPEEFQVANLLAVAQDTSERSSQLAKLYLDRCFRLSAGDAGQAADLEAEIRRLLGE
jgi:hypothetical protein